MIPRLAPRRLVGSVVAVLALGALLVGGGQAVVAPPADGARGFGSTPFDDAYAAADGANRSCGLSTNGLLAMMLAVTWAETGAGSSAPSPMTLSRYDTNSSLYAFSNPSTGYQRAFWHPGVGMWQLDSAGGTSSWGLGSAAQHISTFTASTYAANTMASRYCGAGGDGAQRRTAAWGPWHACGGGDCEAIFEEIYAGGSLRNLSSTTAVGRYGGMEARSCTRGTSALFTCYYVDPARAQGANGWVSPSWGRSPVSAPFYVFAEGGREVRVWLREDTGYGIDVAASRPLGQNVRSSVVWSSSTDLCVRSSTAAQTFCDVSPAHPFFDEIEWVAAQEIAGGYANGDFQPAAAVSRQAMAAFMYRLAGGGEVAGPAHFSDVSTTHPFFREVEWLYAQGVVEGYPDGTFKPLAPVSRQAMAAFMYRLADEHPAFRSHPAPSYHDVSVGRPFYDEIHWLSDNGISQGYDDGTFRPDATVTRMAMAAFLQRLDPLV